LSDYWNFAPFRERIQAGNCHDQCPFLPGQDDLQGADSFWYLSHSVAALHAACALVQHPGNAGTGNLAPLTHTLVFFHVPLTFLFSGFQCINFLENLWVTEDGARVVMFCVAFGANKDRKAVLKAFKGFFFFFFFFFFNIVF
jgi:hypothetical protein